MCCTAELALRKPPRRRGSTLPVTIAIAGDHPPGVADHQGPPRRRRRRPAATRGRLVTTSIRTADDRAHDPVDPQLAEAVGQPADQRRPRPASGRRRRCRPAASSILGHADVGHQVGADVRDHGEAAEHQRRRSGRRPAGGSGGRRCPRALASGCSECALTQVVVERRQRPGGDDQDGQAQRRPARRNGDVPAEPRAPGTGRTARRRPRPGRRPTSAPRSPGRAAPRGRRRR